MKYTHNRTTELFDTMEEAAEDMVELLDIMDYAEAVSEKISISISLKSCLTGGATTSSRTGWKISPCKLRTSWYMTPLAAPSKKMGSSSSFLLMRKEKKEGKSGDNGIS